MINMNIRFFRRRINMTQEQLAEKLNVTRQTLAKWENGEATPNINDCINMSEIFQIKIDDLASPKGKHIFGIVTVGEKGQMVIPKDARKIFDINPGDKLMVLGDEEQGIAIVKTDAFTGFANEILKAYKEKGVL